MIDAKKLEVVNTFDLSPSGGPTALALDNVHQRLFSACRKDKNLCVVDATSGKVITKVPIGTGVDAVVYDAAAKIIICSNGDGTATVIEQQSPDCYEVVQTLATPVRAKTMAYDPATHKIYFSVAKFEAGSRTPVPGTFQVLVYKEQ